MKAVRWVQQDWLRASGAEAAVFVFDPETIAEYSLKRIQFIYECLLEIPVEIRLGPYEDEVAGFARQHRAGILVTTETPDPRVRAATERLGRQFTVRIETPEPFVMPAPEPGLKRFSHYWARVGPLLLCGPTRRRS